MVFQEVLTGLYLSKNEHFGGGGFMPSTCESRKVETHYKGRQWYIMLSETDLSVLKYEKVSKKNYLIKYKH